MTSKEALTELYKQVLDKKRRTLKEVISGRKQYKKVYNDLKILDILKKCDDEIETLFEYVSNAYSKNKITDEEICVIREWLDNEY